MKAPDKTWLKLLSKWWHGEFKVDESPGIVAFYTEWHWTATVARRVVKFYLRHWQWFWSTLIALVALVVSVKAI